MDELQQKTGIAHLYYPGQFVEIDCGSLCEQLGIKVKLVDGLVVAGAGTLLEENGVKADIGAGAEEIPAFVSGRIIVVRKDDYVLNLNGLPRQLAGKLSPDMNIHVVLVDPTGSFSANSQLLEVHEDDDTLRIARYAYGIFHRWRRFLRVAIRGRAFFMSEEVIEGENEGTLIDLGGAGVRVEISASWLKVGDELALVIDTGFMDQENMRHVALNVTVPSRVVWLRQVQSESPTPLYQVGLAFTEISMVDQDRLIGFILAYESSRME
jgi:hypothetical protein